MLPRFSDAAIVSTLIPIDANFTLHHVVSPLCAGLKKAIYWKSL